MRFAMILFVTMATMITWQSPVLAGVCAAHDKVYAEESKKSDTKDKQKGSSDQEPECE